MKRLVEWADVLAENFRPGVLERLGFGYDVCKKWNPSIIYASNSGFGHAGEWAERPSYDGMAQAFTGVLTHNGGGPSHAPREIGWTFSDVVGANAFVNAILMALVHRERTGKGQLVLCSQAGATLYFQRQEVATALNNFAGRQRDDGRRPWERFVFQQVHKASDGRWVCFSVTKKEQLKRLVEDALERPDLLTAEVISRWPSPKRDVAAKFRQDICNIIAKNTSAHWISRMVASNVPCAPVSTYGELGSPLTSTGKHMRDNGVVVDVSHRDFGPLTVVAHPATFSASARPPVAAHAPNIGEHNQSILKNVLRFFRCQSALYVKAVPYQSPMVDGQHLRFY